MEKTETDMVNSPPHYNKANIECINAIQAATDDGYEYYLQGNILKYLWRYDYQSTMTKDTEQSLKNLIDAIELDSPMLIEKENK